MTYKWNSADAETYAKAFSNLICNEFFKTQNTISGGEILKITEINQLNLLVIRNLFEKWNEESSRIKSPYFDFNNDEVKTALAEFMNILSRFISVNKDKFESLLALSVKDTLQLCLEPRSYYENLMRNLPEFKLTPEWIENNKKYFQINKEPLLALETQVNGQNIFANQAIEELEGIFTYYLAEDASELLEDFDNIMKLNLGNASSKKSFFDEALENTSEPIKTLELAAKITPPAVATVTPTVKPMAKINEMNAEPRSLNDKLINVNRTLNDKVVLEKNKNLLDSHSTSKITSLKNGISLNQRFLFINNLFGGNQDAYHKTIENLESCGSLAQAQNLIVNEVAIQHSWDNKSVEAEEFYALIGRKFS